MDFGPGTGGSGAGYYGSGSGTNPFFQFLVPSAYVNGGYGNSYEYGQPTLPENGGFGGGQSPIGLLTPITQITGDGSFATCTTSVPHGYPFNYIVNISGTTYYDGVQTIQVLDPSTFVFASSNTETVSSGTVSGLVTGSSGGGGYTGSPGDGTQGATCYADPSVQNFTDLGAISEASGYVTISLVNPVPLVQTITWNQTWTYQPSTLPYQTTWSACAYGNATYVSVSNNGTFPVTYSTDGINWLTQTYGAYIQPWVSVTFGNGLFAAVANNGYSMTSPDGISWTVQSGAPAWTSITSGNGLFVATATDIGAAYSTDGLNWTPSAVVQPDTWSAVTSGNGTFVAVTNYGTTANVMYSGDGNVWSNVTTGTTSNSWSSVTYGNGTFVACTSGRLNFFKPNYSFNGSQNIALNSDGSVLAFGSPFDNSLAGVVHVYTNGNLSYTLHDSGGQFGSSVALSSDGSVLAVGAPSTNNGSGSVFVYANGTPLSFSPLLGDYSGDYFGTSVALSSDGSVLAVGAPAYGALGYVRVYLNGVPTIILNGNSGDYFGTSVALSSDGSILAVGAAGFLGYVNVYLNGSLNYTLQNPDQSYTSGSFGQSVALSSDGTVLAVGTPSVQTHYFGYVYVYTNGTLTYTLQAPVPAYGDGVGLSVSMSSDGSVVATASSYFYSSGPGQAYVYTNGILTYTPQDQVPYSVALNSDGSILAGGDTTSAYVYYIFPTTPTKFEYSLDGQNWAQGTPLSFSSRNVTYGNGYFAALSGTPSTPQVALTTDVTSPWQYSTVQSASYTGITYGTRGFVGVSPTKFTLEFTPQFWINPAQVSNSNKLNFTNWNGLAYGNGTFVAVGNGLIQGTQDQGNTWNSFIASSSVLCITYSQNLGTFVAISDATTNGTYTSQDGVNWTQHTNNLPPGFLSLYSTPSITYGNGLFVSVLGDSNWVFYSRDGVYWDVTYTPAFTASISYGNGTFVAVGLNSVMSSIDGIHWNGHASPGYVSWVSVTFGNGLFVAVSTDGGSMYSSDGASWFLGNLPIYTWPSVTYGNGYFMTVSNNGTYPVAYSQNGINWSTQTTGFQTTDWVSIAFGQNTFMALGAEGATTMITQLGETF